MIATELLRSSTSCCSLSAEEVRVGKDSAVILSRVLGELRPLGATAKGLGSVESASMVGPVPSSVLRYLLGVGASPLAKIGQASLSRARRHLDTLLRLGRSVPSPLRRRLYTA